MCKHDVCVDLYACVCERIFIRICMHVYTRIYMYIYICAHAHAYTYIYMHIHTYSYMHIYIYVFVQIFMISWRLVIGILRSTSYRRSQIRWASSGSKICNDRDIREFFCRCFSHDQNGLMG